MVTAIQLDSHGNEIPGTERRFGQAHWDAMSARYGETLRWRKVEEAKPLKKKKQLIETNEDEKTDFPSDDGGDAAVNG